MRMEGAKNRATSTATGLRLPFLSMPSILPKPDSKNLTGAVNNTQASTYVRSRILYLLCFLAPSLSDQPSLLAQLGVETSKIRAALRPMERPGPDTGTCRSSNRDGWLQATGLSPTSGMGTQRNHPDKHSHRRGQTQAWHHDDDDDDSTHHLWPIVPTASHLQQTDLLLLHQARAGEDPVGMGMGAVPAPMGSDWRSRRLAIWRWLSPLVQSVNAFSA